MTSAQALGSLSANQELARSLVEGADAATCRAQFHPLLSPLGWYFGRVVYQETYWLQGEVLGRVGFSDTVRGLFTPGAIARDRQGAMLPERAELLQWGRRLQEDNLMLLANPGHLPAHPLLENDFLTHFLDREYCRAYEAMVLVLTERRLQGDGEVYRAREPLRPALPEYAAREIPRGHFRVGADHRDPGAYDNELPPQAVELDAFRIAAAPVTNAHYLAFMEAGGYERPELWVAEGDEEGDAWRRDPAAPRHPHAWRRDADGNWYGLGVNGPYELAADAPLYGINHYEASAYAAWVASSGGAAKGAVLPHEYQWEVARRMGALELAGRAWEWCANPFHAYAGFRPRPSEQTSAAFFDGHHYALRGGSLHTRPSLRRPSVRNFAPRGHRHLIAGLRLVFPPA
jgi:iron(II)-dependent oxidoreductase